LEPVLASRQHLLQSDEDGFGVASLSALNLFQCC
jgi:hypothetical protein